MDELIKPHWTTDYLCIIIKIIMYIYTHFHDRGHLGNVAPITMTKDILVVLHPLP